MNYINKLLYPPEPPLNAGGSWLHGKKEENSCTTQISEDQKYNSSKNQEELQDKMKNTATESKKSKELQ